MSRTVARYREFEPCEPLRAHVRAFFSFSAPFDDDSASHRLTREVLLATGDVFCSPLFADGHVSLVFNLARSCHRAGFWQSNPSGPHGEVIGPMSRVGPPAFTGRAEMVGVYFRAGRAGPFSQVSAPEITDRIVPLGDLPGRAFATLPVQLCEAGNEAVRIHVLESSMLDRLRQQTSRGPDLHVSSLAGFILRAKGRLTVQSLADASGISRQHMTRLFRESVGVTPKLYARLARFQSALAFADGRNSMDWAQAAIQAGYCDQSHMIGEFREFSSLTPECLAAQRYFHPFIERASANRNFA